MPIEVPDLPDMPPPPESEGSAPAQDAVTKVTVTGAKSLAFYDSTRFSAVVEGRGRFTSDVTWSIESGGGALSAPTGEAITYTAPLVSVATPVTLRAVSQMDPTKAGVLTFHVTPPPPPGEFLEGTYAGTGFVSKQEGDESANYNPPVGYSEETRQTTYKLTRVSDTQVRLWFFDGFPQNATVDLLPNGTLVLQPQETGYLPQYRCGSRFGIGVGAQMGAGTWDYKGHLTLNWPSRETYSCNYSVPGGPSEENRSYHYTYREYRVTAVKDPTASYP